MSFIRNVSMTFSTRVVLFIVGLVTSIVMARTIGPEGKGLFSLAVLAAAVVYNSTNLGIGTGSGYFLGRKRIPLEILTGNWLSLSVIIGISALAVSVFLAPSIVPRVLPSVPVWFVMVALIGIPFAILIYNFQSLFKASNDFRRFNALELSQPTTFLILFVVLIYIFPGHRIPVAVITYMISFVAGGILAVILIGRVTELRFRWSRGLVRSTLIFGVQGYLANFLAFLNLRLDLLLVNLFLEPRFVGYYSISVMVAEKIWYIPDVLSVVLHPRVAHGNEEEANRDTAMVCRQVFMIVLLWCLGILVFGRFMVRVLFSEVFLPAVVPLFILLPGIVSASLARVVSSDLLARGYPRVTLWAGLSSLLANIVLNIALIPRMGVSGAALATAVSYTLNALVIVVAFISITGVSPFVLLVPGKEDIKLLASGIRRIVALGRGKDS